jgi:RNA polymerase sigma-70 factor (ECF subfamily)
MESTLPTDEELMLRVARHDDFDAFSTLVSRHEGAARTYAWRLTRAQEEAEDAVQEAFLRVWRRREKWRPTGTFRAFLYRVVNNIALDGFRRKKVRREVTVPDVSQGTADTDGGGATAVDGLAWRVATTADDSPDPRTRARDAEAARMLAAAIETLPDRQRAAILLFHQDDLSMRDAGESLGISQKAFESLLARARGALRTTLEEGGYER